MNRLILICAAAALLGHSALGAVVINEIYYNAPEVDDLEYIELHNASVTPVDISNWRFTKGIKFQFPSGARLQPHGFIVICRNRERFSRYFESPVLGVFNEKLSNDGETLELSDASGNVVDRVAYTDRPPWPLGADGCSGSLERISPLGAGNDPANWASSPLSLDRTTPTGSPGKANASYSAEVPPVIASLKLAPELPRPGQPIQVTAELHGTNTGVRLSALFKTLAAGKESPETVVPLQEQAPGKFFGTIPGQLANQVLRIRVGARGASGATRYYPPATEPRPFFSTYVAAPVQAGRIPVAHILTADLAHANPGEPHHLRGPGGPHSEEAPAGPATSAFIYFDPATAKYQVFDYIQIAPRKGGWKVRFNKDQMLGEISTLNIVYETDRGTLAEPLAYELYRRAGMAASLSWHMRLSVNGQPLGYHLAFEQVNRAFLRRNKMDDSGNLYKILWYEQGVARQHEKKTNESEGHDDVIGLVRALENSSGEAQWEVIKKHFDVTQVATYFAVNMVLSHWDGFFNNYFTYHDTKGTKKWTIYPWDQDQTWGIVDQAPGSVFYDMPITFGMKGDVPPNRGQARRQRFSFGDGPFWWRPPGWFSGPLLANPHFRPIFLARTRQILEEVYTEQNFFPVIDEMAEKLREEIRVRAETHGSDAKRELQQFEMNIKGFKEHLTKRRQYLLAQPEVKNAPRLQ